MPAALELERFSELEPFTAFLDYLGIARDDQVIRAPAHRGVSGTGLELTVESLIPEMTITADGVSTGSSPADCSCWLTSSPRSNVVSSRTGPRPTRRHSGSPAPEGDHTRATATARATASASCTPLSAPFSKSSPSVAMVLVMCARHTTCASDAAA